VNEELDDDEIAVLVVAAIISLFAAIRWYLSVFLAGSLNCPPKVRISLLLTPLVCLFVLFLALNRLADHEVRESGGLILLFLCVGCVCLAATAIFLAIIGISARDDAIERGNPAAAIVICAAFLAITLCFAGANIGEGGTIWTTIGPAALAIGALFLLWFSDALFADTTDIITIDRDVPTAIRKAGFFVATGLILGNAVAGNWVSAADTWNDFLQYAWPALLLLIIAAFTNRLLKLRKGSIAWLPAIFYILFALIALRLGGHK